jgi:hypothetical protein
MLLRCTTLHQWAWHDAAAFVSVSAPIGRNGAGGKPSAGKARAAALPRRRSKKRPADSRKGSPRKVAKAARGSSGRKKRRR